ncbi:hypothetical protein VitviT2T_013361 [Vitis vinifera]|uniref:Uncharacterized protein n=2 Tax=Vitis vinifera TaxID=29760 RepID=A0ABY9CGH0_VITVI|eukprot:XP_002284032.1 PREDICTED: uncharacterized protein LOC100249817 [Vitis vinifera]
MAKVCCSIEMEPRTLNEGQLHHAREAAVDIVQKMEPKEASNVFADGMRQVVTVKEMEQLEQMAEKEQLEKLAECNETAPAIGGPCQCSCFPTNLESPDQAGPREPLSAPF